MKTGTVSTVNASDGELLVRTGVTGPAARMGHRLTIAMTSWQGTVQWSRGEPAAVELTVEVDSLQVLRGEGGVKALSGAEKSLVRSNALKSLGAERYPRIRFRSDDVTKTAGGYRLTGTLEIHGTARQRVVDLNVEDLGDSWLMSCESAVRQTEFGVTPYSLFMGTLKVVDEATVSFTAVRAKDD